MLVDTTLKFSQYPYHRPDMEKIGNEWEYLLKAFENACSAEEQQALIDEINALRAEFSTLQSIAEVRHTLDTQDPFYREEQDFYDEQVPRYADYITRYYKLLINSPFKQELAKTFGNQLFAIAEAHVRSYSPEIVEEMTEENKLSSQYTRLIASAKIPFEGETYNLSGMQPFLQSPDRSTRKAALAATFNFFEENNAEIDEIYDRLVKVRDRMARKLGFRNFVELGYLRMQRTDYGQQEVSAFREFVRKHFVPVAVALRERQRQRIGVEKLYVYDQSLMFKSGNANPKGPAEWIIEQGRRMYRELSPETHEFFEFMIEHELMDLLTRPGKAGGGYCTMFQKYGAPFIFANFNGTAADIDVLTHEAGHAFQVYQSRHFTIPEYHWPTYEACEIHSMSMEFFTWPWMHLFFKEDTTKYHFAHLSRAIAFLPYGVAVDEFQHFVYENPDASPAERDSFWQELEKRYLPDRDYDDLEYLKKGTLWKKQSHIFRSPFYYIDYTLAQICAFQFWVRMSEDHSSAWSDYLTLCRAGGSRSFLKLVSLANLKSPFDEKAFPPVMAQLQQWLDQIDDRSL